MARSGLREVASELNAVWESGLPRSAGLLVVLLRVGGAHDGRALAMGGSPLYGRLDAQIPLEPFDYYDAGQMVARYSPTRPGSRLCRIRRPTGQSRGDRRLLHPLGENIAEQLLSPHGVVRARLSDRDRPGGGTAQHCSLSGCAGQHRAGGPKRWRDRCEDGPASRRALKRMIDQLEDMSYLVREVNFGASPQRGIRYRLADPAARFHYGIGMSAESAVATLGPQAAWRVRIEPEAFHRLRGTPCLRRRGPPSLSALGTRAGAACGCAMGQMGWPRSFSPRGGDRLSRPHPRRHSGHRLSQVPHPPRRCQDAT